MMKKVENLEELPKAFIEEIQEEYEEPIGLEEVYDYIKDCVGYEEEPKKKGEFYYTKFKMIVDNKEIVAQSKRYIKDRFVICDEEFDAIYM